MSDGDVLLVSFDANTKKYERNVDNAWRHGGNRFRQIRKEAEQAGTGIEKAFGNASKALGAFGKGLAGGIVGGLAIGGLDAIIGRVGDLAKGVANIGNEARRAGLSNRTFQELSHVANQARVPIDALVDGMKELHIRADEFLTDGTGAGADAFRRLGFTATELRRKLQDPAALLAEILERMRGLEEFEQKRLFEDLFGGTGGEQFVQLMAQGADGIRAMVKEAHDLGLVLDDEVIQRADEIDRKFSKITATVGTSLKSAVVEVVGAMDDWLDRFNRLEEQTTRNVQSALVGKYQELADAKAKLADLEQLNVAYPGSEDTNIDRQKQAIEELTNDALKLRDILDRRSGYSENFIYKTGEEAKGAKPPVNDLNNALSGTGSATSTAANGIKTFADAIRGLKSEIPELAEQLATLDARSRIDGVYNAALSKARTMGEVYQANALRDTALAALASKDAREAADKGMLDLIGYAEGTDKGRGYNETLAYGKFAGGPKNLVTMSLDEIDAMQTSMLRHPDNTYNSSATGRYQIVQKTLRGLRSSLGLKGTDIFDAGMQDRLAQELLRQRGNDPSGLRNEWEGLRKLDDATIRRAYDGSSVRMPAIDPGKAANIEQARQQADAYAEIVAGAKAYQREMASEQTALSMTARQAAALRYEQEMLNSLTREGIQLSPQQRTQIQQLAQGMAQAEESTERLRQKQEESQEAGRFFGQQMTDALTGLLTGTMTAEQALQSMLQTLIKVGLQAVLMGEGPLAGLFGGGGGSSGGGFGGILGGLFGALFGFESGGYTGDGNKSEPAGVVHRGEFVMSKKAVERIGVGNLDAMHRGALRGGYEAGGYVGDTPKLSSPDLSAINTVPAQAISISAPVTVNTNGGGTPEQNADMARQMAKAMENTMRGVVADEMRKQTRPGNFANSRSR